MRKCYGMVSFSVLLNGSSIEYFHGFRGLRQGDPLSHFLFLVVAKAFGALLFKVYQGGLMVGFQVGNNALVVSHLQFGDDTLVMYRNSTRQLNYLRCVICCFEAIAGLKVNL